MVHVDRVAAPIGYASQSSLWRGWCPKQVHQLIFSLQAVLSRRALKLLEAEAAEREQEERDGIISLRLPLADLFAKQGVISVQLDASVKNVQSLEVIVSMATPLMPEHLLRELNPLTITIVKATGLPDQPVSHERLRDK